MSSFHYLLFRFYIVEEVKKQESPVEDNDGIYDQGGGLVRWLFYVSPWTRRFFWCFCRVLSNCELDWWEESFVHIVPCDGSVGNFFQ